MRRVEERSLSSILRSELLTALINNDLSENVNASGWATVSDKFGADADVFSRPDGRRKRLCLKNLSTRRFDFL
jgi:hypothetical protein